MRRVEAASAPALVLLPLFILLPVKLRTTRVKKYNYTYNTPFSLATGNNNTENEVIIINYCNFIIVFLFFINKYYSS